MRHGGSLTPGVQLNSNSSLSMYEISLQTIIIVRVGLSVNPGTARMYIAHLILYRSATLLVLASSVRLLSSHSGIERRNRVERCSMPLGWYHGYPEDPVWQIWDSLKLDVWLSFEESVSLLLEMCAVTTEWIRFVSILCCSMIVLGILWPAKSCLWFGK